MEFKKHIQVRRSVRAYSAPPSREDLEQILKEAQQAPSWKNSQTTRWYVAETPEKREEVRQALHAANQKKAVNAALIVSTYVRDIAGFTNGNPDNEVGNGWGAYDLGLHDAYLLLAAKNAGFDTLIMGLREGARVREIFSIPEEEEILSVIAIGRGAEEPVMRPRKALEEIVVFA